MYHIWNIKYFLIYTMEAQSSEYEIPEYRCSFCNYAFTTYLSKATHEDKGKCKNKKFSCDKCHARFARKEYLKKHTCGKEFQCEYCERKFKRELDLRMHEEKQTTPCQKEYECYDCGRKFRNTTQMKKHTLYYCTENITPI